MDEACVRFKEIAARFVDDANRKMLSKATMSKNYRLLKGLFVQKSQLLLRNKHWMIRLPPTNLSTTVWFITMYMLRLGALCAFK